MTLSARQLTQLHRRQQLALRDATKGQVKRLWPALEWEDLDGTFPAFAAGVAGVVAANRRTSAGLAASYLRAFRVASGHDGNVRVVAATALPAEQFATSLRVTSLVAAKKSAAAGVAAPVAMGNALTQTAGAMSRLALNSGRETVIETIHADDRASGWRRVLGGAGCDFCRERAGIRINSEMVFESHGGCGCSAEPVYG